MRLARSAKLPRLSDAPRRHIVPIAAGILGITAIAVLASITVARLIPSPRNAPNARTGWSAPLPLAVTPHSERLLYDAEQILTGDCMRRQDFKYWPIPFSGPMPAAQQSPYFISSVAWAQRNGFGKTPSTHSAGPDPNRYYFDHLASGRQTAYGLRLFGLSPHAAQVQVAIPLGGVIGHSQDGCQASAERNLYGNFGEWFRASTVVANLKPTWQAQVVGNPRYKSAVIRWARCMQTEGYTWSSPADAATAFRLPPEIRPPKQEIHAAVASAWCAMNTNLAAITRRLNASSANTLRAKYRSEVTALRRLQLQAIPVAQAIIKR